jgi:penicillin-binding protein 2
MQLPLAGQRRWRSKAVKAHPIEVARHRSLLLRALILLLFGILAIQLFRLQVVQHNEFDARAVSNRNRTIPELPSRGLIYDRNGVQLVENVPIFSAAVVPADVPESDFLSVVAGLADITHEDPAVIANDILKAQESDDPYTPLIVKENIDEQTAFVLRERQPNLPGTQVVVESIRDYTSGSLVSHFLGFVGRIDEEEYADLRSQGYLYLLNDHLGKAGVEYVYEATLRGAPGYREVEIDAAGEETNVIRSVDPQAAGNLVLSVDLDLQRQVEKYLREGQGSSLNAAAIVMDVHTGGILSMVSLPTYDNNILTNPVDEDALQALYDDPAKPMVNHAIAEVHPPGSTFKQITGTAALQEGVANPDTTITSYGSITVEDEYDPDRTWVMRDWQALGTMNFYRGLAMSSDVYFYYLSGGYYEHSAEIFHGLGASRLAAYAREYGLGAPTGIDLPGEAAGNVPDEAWKKETFGEDAVWTLGDTYNFGIGQGFLTTTPIQMVRVAAAIANGGNVLVPQVVQEVVDDEGNVIRRIEPEVAHKLSISPANLSIMQEALRQAADYGPANTGASQYVTIAGKTGTAEFGQPLADGTYPNSHAWYTAYAPYDDPEIAVVVFLEQGVGATNAGPVAKHIFDYYFSRSQLVEGQP